MKKIIFIIGIIVIIILVVVLNLSHKESGKDVEVALVKKGAIVSRVSASGNLKAKSQIDISAETIGRIKKIYYKEGDYVKKGNLIIELDDIKARANKKLARAQLAQAKQDFTRAKELFEKKLISEENFEKAKLHYESARASYEQALDAYNKTKIYAPISGKIMKINVEEGETAVMGTMNYQGTVLMTIADLSRMIAVVKVDETDIPQIKIGQAAEVVADALPDSAFKGKVTKVGLMPIVSHLATETATEFEVEIELDEFSPRLRPGMNVKADIIVNKKSDVLTIPLQAVGRKKKKKDTVFLVKDGRAELKEVEIGARSDTDAEIISGLVEGDTVIIGPYRILSKLKDGDLIQFEESEESKEKAPSRKRAHRLIRFIKKYG